jgi:hypothetical protein
MILFCKFIENESDALNPTSKLGTSRGTFRSNRETDRDWPNRSGQLERCKFACVYVLWLVKGCVFSCIAKAERSVFIDFTVLKRWWVFLVWRDLNQHFNYFFVVGKRWRLFVHRWRGSNWGVFDLFWDFWVCGFEPFPKRFCHLKPFKTRYRQSKMTFLVSKRSFWALVWPRCHFSDALGGSRKLIRSFWRFDFGIFGALDRFDPKVRFWHFGSYFFPIFLTFWL